MGDNYTLAAIANPPGEKSTAIKLSNNRRLVVGGEPVELSDEEVERLQQRGHTLEKAEAAAPEQTDNPEDTTTESSGKEVK